MNVASMLTFITRLTLALAIFVCRQPRSTYIQLQYSVLGFALAHPKTVAF